MATNEREIKTSIYDIEDKWLKDIAPKFFENMEDISLLNAGLFGYVNNVMANTTEDMFHAFSVQSNEVFPNKAVLPSSIYAYASLAQYTDLTAKPSKVPFVLILRKKDILAQSVQKADHKELRIGRKSKLLVDNEFTFMLDYDVIIMSKESQDKNDYIVTARYDMTMNSNISTIRNPYIHSTVVVEAKEEYVFLRLDAQQLDYHEHRFINYNNDVVYSMFYELEFTGKLAGFNVMYKGPNDTSYRFIKSYYKDSTPEKGVEFCYYEYPAEDKINISFSAYPSYFRPDFNGEILVELFTTDGSLGNFNYTGANCTFEYELDPQHQYSHVLTQSRLVGSSTGGQNQPDLSTIKDNTIRELYTRGNYITETDLNNYFAKYESINKILFTKKRDDLIRRIYYAYVLMKDFDDNIIPTNTIDLLINNTDFDNYLDNTDSYSLAPGSKIIKHNPDDNLFKVNKEPMSDTDILKLDGSTSEFLYTNPFLVKLTKDPLFVSYYLNSVFDNYILSYKYLNQNAFDQFTVNSIDIERNAIKTDDYKIKFDLITTLDLSNVIIVNQVDKSFVADLGNVQAKIFIKENGNYTGYLDADIVGYDDSTKYLHCEAKINTNDTITADNKMYIFNSVKSTTVPGITHRDFYIGNSDVEFEVVVLYNGYLDKSKSVYQSMLSDYSGYCVTNVYSTEDNVELFKDLNNIMSSSLIPKLMDDYNELYYRFKSVPVVRYMYLQDDDNMKFFIQRINEYKDILNDVINLMENNFDIDMKFYNTYGRSKFFTIGIEKDPINNTSISMGLTMKIIGDVNPELINDIKRFIIDFVEDTNENDEINFIYYSNLSRALEVNFEQIGYIVFDGFNDYPTSDQIIENTFESVTKLSKEQVIKFVPEYLNVNRRLNGNNEYVTDLNINFN